MSGQLDRTPRIVISQGELAGLMQGDVHLFRGIPYAQPPVGPLRWAPPQPPSGWNGTRDATRFGDVAPQGVRLGFDFQTSGESEDCLYLNVATTTLDPRARQPVMVWIHGGGNLYGAASDPLYDPANFAKQGVTFVSFNYRLGVFGFLSHPLFGANFAVLDYIAALEWVRDNIAHFGGDADNVTIFGQSAGAVAVRALLSSPRATGLFKQAIIQSAGFEAKATGEWWSRETNEETVSELFGALGTQDPAELRAKSTDQILEAAAALSGAQDRPGLVRTPAQLVWMPVVDGETVVGDGSPAWTANVSVMIGTVANEARFFLRPERKEQFDRPLVERMTKALAGRAAPAVLDWFDEQGLAPYAALDALVTTTVFSEPAKQSFAAFASQDGRFFAYHFARVAPGARNSEFLASHACELPYLFGTMEYVSTTRPWFGAFADKDWYDDTDRLVASRMQRAWTSFARSGIPQSDGRAWPDYRADEPCVTIIGESIEARPVEFTALEQIIERSRDPQARRSWLGSPLEATRSS